MRRLYFATRFLIISTPTTPQNTHVPSWRFKKNTCSITQASTHLYACMLRERQTDGKRDRQTDRERDRGRETERDRQREIDRERDRQRQTETDRQTDRERERERQRDRHTHTHTHTEGGRERVTHSEAQQLPLTGPPSCFVLNTNCLTLCFSFSSSFLLLSPGPLCSHLGKNRSLFSNRFECFLFHL